MPSITNPMDSLSSFGFFAESQPLYRLLAPLHEDRNGLT